MFQQRNESRKRERRTHLRKEKRKKKKLTVAKGGERTVRGSESVLLSRTITKRGKERKRRKRTPSALIKFVGPEDKYEAFLLEHPSTQAISLEWHNIV